MFHGLRWSPARAAQIAIMQEREKEIGRTGEERGMTQVAERRVEV